jgi:hypothetical protein
MTMRLAVGQRLHVIGRDVVDKVHALVAVDDELAHVRHVEQSARLANGFVLDRDAAGIVDRHLVAGERNDLGAERLMDVVQRGALKRR